MPVLCGSRAGDGAYVAAGAFLTAARNGRHVSMEEIPAFAESVYVIDGPDVRDFGIWFTTRMTVVKLSNGSVWVHSPVPASLDTLHHILTLGTVEYLVAGTPRHVWRLAEWHTLFPEAQLWRPRNTPATLQKGHLPYTGILGNTPPPDWSDDFDQLAFQGNPLGEEVIFFHRASGTVILDDLIQIHSPRKGHPFNNALLALVGVAAPQGGVSLDLRLTFIHRALARQSLDYLLSWDFDKLIIAHGPCIEHDAKPFVEKAFQWLRHSS